MNELLPSAQAVLETTAPRWLTLAAGLPPDVLHRSRAPGEWSAVECLRHLRDAERDVFPVRGPAFLAGQNLPPTIPWRRRAVTRVRHPWQWARTSPGCARRA